MRGLYVDSSSSVDRLSHMTDHMTKSERPGTHEVAVLEEAEEEEQLRPHIWIPGIPCGHRHRQHNYVWQCGHSGGQETFTC